MPIEGFDYKEFAQAMSEQAVELVPKDLQDFEKQYIVKTLTNFTLLAGEALSKDESLNLNADQAVFITQIIAEWSFHKSIDLIHSGILPEFWDGIMQKIAFTIFEIAKQAIMRNIPQEQLLQAVEHHVNKVYKQGIEELEQKGIINEEIKQQAENQSNIDEMAKQVQEEQARQVAAEQAQQAQQQEQQEEPKQQTKNKHHKKVDNIQESNSQTQNSIPQGITHKQMKLMSLAMVLKILSQDKVVTILNKFSPDDSETIAKYMDMADLESMVEGDLVTDCIKEIKNFLPIKRKLSQENVLLSLLNVYKAQPREVVEQVIKNERPIVKRFIAQSYDGEFGELPLKVAGIVADYIAESV